MKDNKKYVPLENAKSLTLKVSKPVVTKKLISTVGQTIRAEDIVSGLPENTTNKVVLSVPKKSKYAVYDEDINAVKLIKKGKVKITVKLINNQEISVKYFCMVKIRKS